MAEGLQRAGNAARATRGLPPRVVHLITTGGAGETACGRLMSKVMHGSIALWDVTCKQCLAAESEHLNLTER